MNKIMFYKIVKYIKRTHKLNPDTKLYDLYEKEVYYVLRKGRIFGFWHTVGDWLCDSQGNSFCYDNEFESISQAQSYINCWHKETYGDKYAYIIDPAVNFK